MSETTESGSGAAPAAGAGQGSSVGEGRAGGAPVEPAEPKPDRQPKRTAPKGDPPKPGGAGDDIKVTADEKIDGVADVQQERMKAPVEVTAKVGGVSTTSAKKVLAQAMAALRGCWKRAVADGASGGGTVKIVITVDAGGSVGKVATKGDAAVAPAESCVRDELEKLTFPDDAGKTVEAQLTFGVGS